MSYDFALQKLCSHEIRMENGFYDNFLGTVGFRTPPSNQNVKVWVNGVEVPKGGLWSDASMIFTNPGPYRIRKNQNDLLYFKLNNGIPYYIQLITGNVSADDLAKYLSKQVPVLNFSVKRERVLVSSKSNHARVVFSFVDPKSYDKTGSLSTTHRITSAYSKLGIIPGRVTTQRMLFSSWTVEKDEKSSWEHDRVIKFRKKLNNKNPVIHISYVTYHTYCRRCRGTKIEFDYNIIGGKYEIVDNTDLLLQEFDKFMFTKLGSHWKWTWLGSRLIDRIGGKGSTNNSTINSMISLDINQAFSVYQNIKMQQSTSSPIQQVTDSEYPASIRNVSVNNFPDDPTVALVSITLTSRSMEPITLKRIVGNPSVHQLGAIKTEYLLRG